MAVTGRMQSLFRSLSGSSKEYTHTHPTSHVLRQTPALDIDTRNEQENSLSLPRLTLDTDAGSLSESLSHSSGSPTCSSLNSPTAAQQQQKHGQQQQGQRRPYKVHGMDPYDYWSMIKSL